MKKQSESVLRVLSAVLSLLMLTGVFAAAPITVSAEETVREDFGDYTFYFNPESREYAGIEKYNGSDSEIAVPDEYKGMPVRNIYNNAFKGNSTLTKVTLPDSLKSIGEYSFEKCSNLSEINIPESVQTISYNAFADCPKLRELTILNKSVTIKADAIGMYYDSADYKPYSSFVLKGYEGSTAEQYASAYHVNFQKLDLGSDAVFTLLEDDTYELTSYSGTAGEVVVPAQNEGKPVTKIGKDAFKDNTNLKKVTFPATLTEIGESAFEGCAYLNDLVFPDGLKKIGARAFYGLSLLSNLTIPDSVTEIGEYAIGYLGDSARLATLTITGGEDTAAYEYANSNGFTYKLDAILIESVMIEGLDAPKYDEDADTTINDSVEYTLDSIVWKNGSGDEVTHFSENGMYFATIVLKAKDGYKFSKRLWNAKVSGGFSSIGELTAQTLTISTSFDAVTGAPTKEISEFDPNPSTPYIGEVWTYLPTLINDVTYQLEGLYTEDGTPVDEETSLSKGIYKAVFIASHGFDVSFKDDVADMKAFINEQEAEVTADGENAPKDSVRIIWTFEPAELPADTVFTEETTTAETTEATEATEATETTEETEATEDTQATETTEATEETTEATEETTAAEPTDSTEETTAEPEQTTVTAAETTAPAATKSFSYLPSAEQKSYTVKLVIQGKDGKFYTYDMSATPMIFDGTAVLSADVPADLEAATVQYQFYDGDKWISQITLTPEQFGKVVTSDGKIYGETPATETTEETTIAPATEPATQAPTVAAEKKDNPIKVKANAVKKVSLKKVKKKAQKAVTFKVTDAKGKVSFKIKSAKKAIKKYLSITKKGVLKVKKWKKAKKGTYTVKVTITAKGNAEYNAKTVKKTVKVKVK